MSHVSTAAAMTTRQTSCAPVQRITVASLGSCQTHLVVEEAMKPRDAGCTTVTPLRRPQHAHTCVGRNAPQVSACSTQSRYPRPWTAQWNEKLGHHHPITTGLSLSPDHHCVSFKPLADGARRDATLVEKHQLSQHHLFFHTQVLHAPSHSIYGLDSGRRLSSREGTRRPHQDNPYP